MAKKIELNMLATDFVKSYLRLHNYVTLILTKNRGSKVKIYNEFVDREAWFQTIFVNYKAIQKSFMQKCSRFVRVNGYNMKTSTIKISLGEI